MTGVIVRTCTLLTKERRGRYGIDLEWHRSGYPCTLPLAVLVELELEPALWALPVPVQVHLIDADDDPVDSSWTDIEADAGDVERPPFDLMRACATHDELAVPAPGEYQLGIDVYGRRVAVADLTCDAGYQIAVAQVVDPFPLVLSLPDDCARVLARAAEFARSDLIGRPTLLQALWSVDVPGAELLRRLGLTRRRVGRIGPQEPDPLATGGVVLDAAQLAAVRPDSDLFDSVDLAAALIERPWGELAGHLESDPIPAERIHRTAARIRPAPTPPWVVDEEAAEEPRGVAAEPETETARPKRAEPDSEPDSEPDPDEEPEPSPVRSRRPQRITGREVDLERLQAILIRSQRRSAFIVGPPGCGKSALVGGLARLVSRDDAHPSLRGVPVVELDVDVLVDRWDKRGSAALREVLQQEGAGSGTVFVVDDLDRWMRWEGALGALLSVAVELETARLLVLATATAHAEVRRVVPAVSDDMDVLTLEPLPAAACVDVLRGLRRPLEKAHGVSIGPDVLEAAPTLADQYLRDVASPTNSIKLLDDACIRAELRREKTVTVDHLREVVESRTGVPVRGLTGREKETLRVLERELRRRVIGQTRAIRAVATTIRRSRTGLGDERRPIGSFLFLGPSGVGKTELAKATADVVFGSPDNLIALDMSEYQSQENVWGLVGATRGFTSSELGGILTEPVRRRPYSLVLFDEMEKAHPRVLDILLQILEEGRLTDGMGQRVDFRHTIVIMTSNLAADVVRGARGEIGFVATSSGGRAGEGGTDRAVQDALQGALRPELLNRLDQVIPFAPLRREELETIAELQLGALDARLRTRGIGLEPTPEALRWLAARGYDPRYGARPLRRLIQQHVTDALVDHILEDDSRARTFRIEIVGDDLRLTAAAADPEA